MAAAIEANLDGVAVELGHKILEIGQDTRGKLLTTRFVEQGKSLRFAERGVEREDIVFLAIARRVADGPIGDDEIGEDVSGAPGVVAAIVNGLVENQVDNRIGSVAHP